MAQRIYNEILADIIAICKDKALYKAKNFNVRAQAIDNIDFHILHRLDTLSESDPDSDQLNILWMQAQKLKQELEEVNQSMFRQLRKEISGVNDKGKLLRRMIDEYLHYDFNEALFQEHVDYDNLDEFLNGLLMYRDKPSESLIPEPEMVYYQSSPASIVFHMVQQADFKPYDVFYDIGSGLGQVVILVSMLANIQSIGIEFEPSFCNYAKYCTSDLNADKADLINVDARHALYNSGTVFFMYTPFKGKMLQDVMGRIYDHTKERTIKLFTYGPCTREMSMYNWLRRVEKPDSSVPELGEFIST